MFSHLDQVNQKHFRAQHLELSDSPINEEVYNLIYWIFMVFKISYLIFSSIVSSPRNKDFFLSTIVPPQFETSAQSSKNINLMPNPLYFKGNTYFLSKHVNEKCLKCLYPFFVGLWGSFWPILERDHQHVLIACHSTTCPLPIKVRVTTVERMEDFWTRELIPLINILN